MADARSDFIFQKVMSRKRICKHLPEELLQIEIADIKSFYDYVNNHIVTTDFTKQIDDEISYLKLDTKVRREFMLMEARLLDERREGIAEGKEIGLAEGEAIGLVKGEAEHKLKVAKLMLAKGCYSLQEITELSGLSLADVEKLKEEA